MTTSPHPDAPRMLSATISDEDPCVGIVKVHIPGSGVLTATYEWDTPEQARARLQQAADSAVTNAERQMEDGETRSIRRIPTQFGVLYLALLGGPPTWRLPKAGARSKDGYTEVMAGWIRRAVVIGWRRHEPTTEEQA